MTSISSLPTSRVSDLLVRSRLLGQLQTNQREVFRLQNQLSTGQRIFRPSDDAPSAVRAIELQRLIERKEQVQINLQTNQSYLSATDTALNSVSSLLSTVRGGALSVVDSTSTPNQRRAVASEVERVIQQLVDTGNQNFRGRYLFAGSRTTVEPFTHINGKVGYQGNESELQSYSDIDVLFESSIHGNEVFGALSEAVRGSGDLNPVLKSTTLVRDLRGGIGISSGSIAVADGSTISVVDLSGAETVGDVARLLETHPPDGRTITVSITPTGLRVEIDAVGGGNLSISEVAGGTTANELGILNVAGTLTNPLVGDDLDPVLRLDTRLDEIFGSRALGRLESFGPNNDITLQAAELGADANGIVVQFVDDDLLQASPGLTAGHEYAHFEESAVAPRAALSFAGGDNDLILTATTPGADLNGVTVQVTSTAAGPATASYDAGTKTLSIDLASDGSSTGNDVSAAIATISGTPFAATLDTSVETTNTGGGAIAAFSDGSFASTGNSGGNARTLYVHVDSVDTAAFQVVDAINAEGTFVASIDLRDAISTAQAGFGPIDLDATATTFGGGGVDFDKDAGIQIENDGTTYELSFATAETVEDLLNILNGSGAGVLAQINADGNGIDIRSRISGANFAIGENGGVTASQLGIRTLTEQTRLESLNRGLGVNDFPGDDLTIETSDGTTLDIDVDGAETIGDILNRINNHVDNGGRVVARLAEFGSGIELIEDDPPGPGTLSVRPVNVAPAAFELGFLATGASDATASAATIASGLADLSAPNSDITFSGRIGGTGLNGARIELVNNLAVGNQALLSYDSLNNVLSIDVDPSATTAQTIVDAVNNQVGGLFAAALSTAGGPNDGSGLVTATGDVATLAGGEASKLQSRDVNPQETEGVFNTLIRLRQALLTDDIPGIQEGITSLSGDLDRVNFARAEIGARQQGLEVLKNRLEDEEIELRSSLSQEIDLDVAEAISNLASRQLAVEASLRATSSILQLTLLNFL